MKTLLKIATGLFISIWISGNTLAQSTDITDTLEILSDPLDIGLMAETLNNDIADLKFLSNEITNADKVDHAVLIYRQDERSFRLLTDYDLLVGKLANLSDEAKEKKELEAQLSKLGEDVGDAIFNRIDEIKHRIIQSSTELETLSGGSFIATQAYINSMEAVHTKYFEALVNHMDSRKTLGMPVDELLNRLTPRLYLYAEVIAGRIEKSDAASTEVQAWADSDPNNADINEALKKLAASHDMNVDRLESIILIFDRLELNSSTYKAIMLQQSSNISISIISVQAIISVLKDSWASVTTGTIFFF